MDKKMYETKKSDKKTLMIIANEQSNSLAASDHRQQPLLGELLDVDVVHGDNLITDFQPAGKRSWAVGNDLLYHTAIQDDVQLSVAPSQPNCAHRHRLLL